MNKRLDSWYDCLMSYSCLEELQVDLDLHALDKISVLSKVGSKYDDGWFVVMDDGICHLFDRDGNLDDIKKVTQLEEKHIRRDITKIVIPDSVTSIESNMFFNCINLTSIMIPNSMTSIGNYMFSWCSELMSVTIPNSVTSIGRSAFSWCSSLISVTIPDSVTRIGYRAFSDCTSLMNVTIPNSVMSIGNYAFYYCDGLTNLIFKDKTLKQIKNMKGYPWGIEDESIIRVG